MFYTTRQVGQLLNQPIWRIQRLFEEGLLNEPARFAGRRIIPADALPAIVDALRARGWLLVDGTPVDERMEAVS